MSERTPKLRTAVRRWWREQRHEIGWFAPLCRLIALGIEFLRDSLPDRRRQRYGDVDYDWEFRVDTTSANVGWRARLLGLLNSPYQPIEPALFREIMNSLAIDCGQFTFIDIGSGKGRALLMASEYPFGRVLGIELLPELDSIAQENILKFSASHPKCAPTVAICADATEFEFPAEPLCILLNNPLPQTELRKMIVNIEKSLTEKPRRIFLVYANPVLEDILTESAEFRKIAGTHQYSIFESKT